DARVFLGQASQQLLQAIVENDDVVWARLLVRSRRILDYMGDIFATNIATPALVMFDGVLHLVIGHHGQQPPYIMRVLKTELASLEPGKETPVHRLNHILRVEAPP